MSDLLSQISDRLKGSEIECILQQHAEDFLKANPVVSSHELKEELINGLQQSAKDQSLRKEVFRLVQVLKDVTADPRIPLANRKEPIAHVRKVQGNWEKRILKSLNTMCTELNLPLSRKRFEKDQQELKSKWTEIGTIERDISNVRPVYGPKDCLEVLTGLDLPNATRVPSKTFWGLISLPVSTISINNLRVMYAEMSINQCQYGVDDSPDVSPELFSNDRYKLGNKVLSLNISPLAQEYCKKGCPVSLRGSLWKLMLGVEITSQDKLYYEQLKHFVVEHDMLIDLLYFKDMKLTATNDDQYFVFEDYIFQVLLPFSRDTAVLDLFERTSSSPPKSYIQGKLGQEEYAVKYPPSGVIPFYGFSMLVAPLCYVYESIHSLYFMFREMYMRYFHKLHSISSNEEGIVGLSALFESLLQQQEPGLFFHMQSHNIQPLRIAFKWLMRAFSGFLSSSEVLLLWDKVFAYNSLKILPVLAVAVFTFRKTNLLKVTSQGAAESVLADLTTLKVIPLIQLSLFST